MKKRVFTLLLALVMILGMLPAATVSAAEEEPPQVSAKDIQWNYAPDVVYAGAINAQQFTLTFTPKDTTVQTARWGSSNSKIASVDENGVVTGIKPGTVTITAWPKEPGAGPTKLDKTITVEEIPLQSVTPNVSALQLWVGDHAFVYVDTSPANASYPELTFTSSDTAVATVDAYGDVVAVGAGKATVTITARNGMTATVDVTAAEPSVQMVIYASPEGKDTAAGTQQDPVSLKGALDLIAKNNGNMTGNIEVILAGGYYRLYDTLTLTTKYDGSNGYSVIWKAAEGQTPVIGGGYTLAGKDHLAGEMITTDNGNIYVYDVSEADLGPRGVRQIYINQVRAVRARSEGPLTDRSGTEAGILCSDTALLDYQKPGDLEIVFVGLWTQPRCGVANISESSDGQVFLEMDQPGWRYVTGKGFSAASAENMVWYENALELLDEPGEWYIDLEAQKLYYMPRSFENVDTMEITLPVFDNYGNGVMDMETDDGNDCDKPLVLICGDDFDDDKRVNNIRFEGITFADATWSRPSGTVGHSDAQNSFVRQRTDIQTTAAVVVKKAQSIHFTGCTFTRLGINGIQMVQGVQNSSIDGNVFFNIGGNAINVAEPYLNEAKLEGNKMVKNITINNNYIHDIGKDYGSSCAISIGFANYITSSHNEIYNIPYSGYHIGYGWTNTVERNLQKIVISHNFIHDLMGDVMNDGGGIYTLGFSDPACNENNYNYITNNYIKNLLDEGGPIYNDECSSWWWIENNVVDLFEVESWPEGGTGSMNWYNNNNQANNLVVINNYATLSKFFDRCTDGRLKNQVQDANVEKDTDGDGAVNWSAEAKAIIDASGLEESYRYMIAGQVEKMQVDLQNNQLISLGEPVTITTLLMDGKNTLLSNTDAKVFYSVKDSEVASVDENGVLTGLSTGFTTVTVSVVSNNVLLEQERDIYVGDYLDKIELLGAQDGLRMSVQAAGGKQVEPLVYTRLGRQVEPEQISYAVANPAVATVDAAGRVTPVGVGQTTLLVTVTAEGEQFTGRFRVHITEDISSEPDNLEEIFKEDLKQNWVISNPENSLQVVDGQTVTTQTKGYAFFAGQRYDNELFSFKLWIDATNGGGNEPALVLRAQEPVNYIETDCYMFCFGQKGIELYRFIDRTRYQIYGVTPESAANNTAKQGDRITDSSWNLEGFHDITVGTIADGDDVRILLIIDGETVIDYLDLGANKALSKAGYFGVIGRGETFTIQKDTTVQDTTQNNEQVESYAPIAILEADKAYAKGSEKDVTIVTDGKLWELKDVRVDGQRVPISYYAAIEGGADGVSAVVTLPAEYVDGLDIGDHSVTAIFTGDRTVEITLKVSANPMPYVISAVIVAVIVAAAAVIFWSLKKKVKKA